MPAEAAWLACDAMESAISTPRVRRVIALVTAAPCRFVYGLRHARLSLRRFDGAQGNPLDFLTVSGAHSTVTSSLSARDTPHGTVRSHSPQEDTAQRPPSRDGRQNGAVWRLGYAGRIRRHRVGTLGGA